MINVHLLRLLTEIVLYFDYISIYFLQFWLLTTLFRYLYNILIIYTHSDIEFVDKGNINIQDEGTVRRDTAGEQ